MTSLRHWVRQGIMFVGAVTLLSIGFVAVPSRSPAQTQPPLPNSLFIKSLGMTVYYPDGWSVAPQTAVNVVELINVRADQQGTLEPSSSIKIAGQVRIDHADAVRELREIATAVNVRPTFLDIGSWPGFQRRHLAKLPQPSRGFLSKDEIFRITAAVAAGSLLIELEAALPSNADQTVIDQVDAILRHLAFTTVGNPSDVRHELDSLRNAQPPGSSRFAPLPPATSRKDALSVAGLGGGPAGFADNPGLSQRVLTGGNGEIEIAVANGGQTIVIVRQGFITTSNDGGQTFPFTVNLGSIFDDGDSSVAVGQSGSIYTSGISQGGCGGNTCTGITRSTDNGHTFPIIAASVVCAPGVCAIPDQPHIAADQVNAAPHGDQVYQVWRNFATQPPSVPNAAIICSQDSGATWTAPFIIMSGDFPRIRVGQDGFVYVVYRLEDTNLIRLRKFSSCAAGLAPQVGFPTTVATVSEVLCPVPGLDRCNAPAGNSLSSHMVAVDDTNPNHIYVAYATNTGVVNEDIVVRDSLNGGATWLAARAVTVNTTVSARRFLPWVCTTNGHAFVTWYDRRAATTSQNDLTDYFVGSAGLDALGNLVAGSEVGITRVSDPQCAAGWPRAPHATGDSELCSVQPQLAGICSVSQARCDYSDGCPTGAGTCMTGRGAPKYGDYNGNACTAGQLLATWASATPPPGITPSGAIDVLFSSVSVQSTTTTVVSSVSSAVAGQAVTFTATVSAVGPGVGIPTGTVTFFDGTTTLGTGTLNGSLQAMFTTRVLSVGPHSITAQYGGDTSFSGSTSAALSESVNKASTTNVVVSSANPAVVGQAVTFTATVSVVAPGAGTPTGTVTFFDGANSLGTGTLNPSHQATLTISTLSGGSHSITVQYGGDANFSGSTSTGLTETVTIGTNVTLTVAIRGSAGGTVTSSPAGINCGSGCSAGFPTGTMVTLTAAPGTQARFKGWSGACSGTATCTLTMNDNFSVTATFSMIFTDATAGDLLPAGTTIKAMHFTELLQAINTVAPDTNLSWPSTNPAPAVGGTVLAIHMNTLRQALGLSRVSVGTVVGAPQLNDVRLAIRGLE